MFDQMSLFNTNKVFSNNKTILKSDLQKLLDKYSDYIEKLLKSKPYKELRENSVPLIKLDAVISFCNINDPKAYKYLMENNKPFAFNVTQGFEDNLKYMMTRSFPIKE